MCSHLFYISSHLCIPLPTMDQAHSLWLHFRDGSTGEQWWYSEASASNGVQEWLPRESASKLSVNSPPLWQNTWGHQHSRGKGSSGLTVSQVSWHTVPHGESVVEKSCSFTVAREQSDSRAGVPILLPYVSSTIQLPSTGSHNHRANLKYVSLLDNFKPQQKWNLKI